MFTFILDLIIFFSLGVVLYLVARTLPRVNDSDLIEPSFKTSRLIMYLEKADGWMKAAWLKFLRRSRVSVLKLDNSIGEKLSKFKKDNGKNEGFKLGLEKEEDETEERS